MGLNLTDSAEFKKYFHEIKNKNTKVNRIKEIIEDQESQ